MNKYIFFKRNKDKKELVIEVNCMEKIKYY